MITPPAPLALTPGQQLFSELERWLSETEAGGLGLRGLEDGLAPRGRELLRVLLQQHLEGRGQGNVGPTLTLAMASGQLVLSHRRLHPRSLLTVFGRVEITRLGYSAPGRPSVHPLDAELELPARSYSYEVQRRLVKAAVCGPFDEALHFLQDATGIVVSKRSAEQMVLDASIDVGSFYALRSGSATLLSPGEILIGAIDGKGIPMVKSEPAPHRVRLRKGDKRNKKRMATVAAVFSQQPLPRTPEDVVASLFHIDPEVERPRRPRTVNANKRVWASLLAGKDAFITDVQAEMARRDPERSHAWVIVTDGERALQRRVCATFQDVTLVLDLLHVLEKLWAAAYVFHAEGSPEAVAFVRERALRILRGQVSQVVKGFRQMVTKRQLSGTPAKTLLDVAAYYYRNRSRMRYHEYLANGWPIASGCVEGACKNLIKDRMERSGMRWTPTMAEAMVQLRAVHLSGDDDAYWDHFVKRDQRRLYPAEILPGRVVAK